MKHIYSWSILFCLLAFLSKDAMANTGDSTLVQTFSFDSIQTRRAVFKFPEENKRYEKVLMYYTLKCDDRTTLDKYPCGEWDYLTYVNIYKDTTFFEIGRYITPYGKRLDLGVDGFTWVQDVTDYQHLLKGDVDLSAGNTAELLDLKFIFIEGIPARDVISVRNLWGGFSSYKYSDLSEDKALASITEDLDKKAKNFVVRSRISGHGHYGDRNCCEWVAKEHYLFINGEKCFNWTVWKDCGNNPIYPQGGTWQFDRGGWCPGTFVDTYDHEITPYLTSKKEVEIDYGIEPHDKNTEEGKGNFVISKQLISYGAPNFKNEAAIVDIVAPSVKKMYNRFNPISVNPIVRIRNNGKQTLKTLEFKYGLEGGELALYKWEGSLEFLETVDISLPKPSWKGVTESDKFRVEILKPNGNKDQYLNNNVMLSQIEKPIVLPSSFRIQIKMQKYGRAKDNSYCIVDENGEEIYYADNFEDGSLVEKEINLSKGAYEFTFFDSKEDGIIKHWWRRGRGDVGEDGNLEFVDKDGNLIYSFPCDFAEKVSLRFFVGEPF